MARKVDPDELVGVAEITKLLGVSRHTVQAWKRRDPTFPQPVVSVAQGSLWLRSDVLTWARRTGRLT